MKDGCAFMFAKLVAGEVTRGDGGIIGVIGNAEAAEVLLNTNLRTRRIREKHGRGAAVAPEHESWDAANWREARGLRRAGGIFVLRQRRREKPGARYASRPKVPRPTRANAR